MGHLRAKDWTEGALQARRSVVERINPMSPIPARFVIDRQGIIRMAESDPDYTTRPEPADTLEAVRALPRQH